MQRIKPVLSTLSYQRKEIALLIATTIYDVVGKNQAMQFLLDEYDQAPFSARRLPFDAWQAYQHQLAGWRPLVTDPQLLDRYFQIVIKRLTQYLALGTQYNESFFKGHQYYWSEKEDAFAAAAVAAYAAHEPSSALADRVASYLRSGIIRPTKAVVFLNSIRQTRAFTDHLRFLLANTLMEISKFQEAAVELKQLYAAKPGLHYGLGLMTCYSALSQRDNLQRHAGRIREEIYSQRRVGCGQSRPGRPSLLRNQPLS